MALYLGNSQIGQVIVGTIASGTNNQSKIVTPTKSTQTITADTGYTGLGTITVNPIPSEYIIPSGNLNITGNGSHNVTNYATVSVSIADTPINNQNITVTPDETTQTITATGNYTGLGTVTVNAISSTYVGSNVSRKAATSYTPGTTNKTIAANTYLTGIQTILGDSNLIAANIKSGVSIFGVTGSYSGSGESTISLQEKTNITPTESSQTITPDTGYNGLSSVQINAISTTYVGSGITRRSSTDLTASEATISVPAGYYSNNTSKSISSGSATAPNSISGSSATITTGTNTLTFTKTISVTPTVSAGYISSGTATNVNVSLTASIPTQAAKTVTPTTSSQTAVTSGTYTTGAITVAAIPSSYIQPSGNLEITENGTDIDVKNYATVSVNVAGSGGSSMNVQMYNGYDYVTTTSYTATDVSLTVAKSGTYDISWVGWRNTTSGTSGSQLYKNGSAYGTATTTFQGSYGQSVNLTGVSLSKNDVLVVRGRARSSSYRMYVANLVIVQTA